MTSPSECAAFTCRSVTQVAMYMSGRSLDPETAALGSIIRALHPDFPRQRGVSISVAAVLHAGFGSEVCARYGLQVCRRPLSRR